MLILDIYNYSDNELTDELQAEKAKLWDHWEKGWPKDLPSGMFCQMYYPKVPGGKAKADVCPPALVFRGSEMNKADLDELAMHIELGGEYRGTGLVSLAVDPTPFAPMIPTISPSGQFPPTTTRAELRAAGLTERPLIANSTGEERIPLHGTLGGGLAVNWTGSASLFYGKNGDWPTNIAQALGEYPLQYQQAISAGRDAASEGMADWNGRLMILGHSLGGGLASAAALAAKKAQPKLALCCNTYNAPGLHGITAERALTSLTEAAGAGITAHSVRGDILTSLQTPGLLPLISDVLRWEGVKLPPAIPCQAPSQGKSPGGPPSMMFTHLERAPKWHSLPNLFPLRNQSLVRGNLATIQGIFSAAANANNFAGFVENFVSMLADRLGNGEGGLDKSQARELQEAVRQMGEEFNRAGPQIKAAIRQPPPLSTFPQVNAGDSGYMREQVGPFLNGMIRDSIEVSQILLAAIDYHMWDACAYTFLLDPPNSSGKEKSN